MPESLSSATRTTITLAVLALLLVVGAVWGWSAVTQPLPERPEATACTRTPIAEGERVYPEQVTVSVLNAGDRSGLAGRVMGQLVDEGFDRGDLANAPRDADVARAQIWSSDPESPAVRLVRSRLGKGVRVLGRGSDAPGVVVVVGDRFKDLSRGQRSVVASSATTICGPSVD